MRWRQFSGIRAKEPGACIRYSGKVIQLPRLPGSLNRISVMHPLSWRITCAGSLHLSQSNPGERRTNRTSDGVTGDLPVPVVDVVGWLQLVMGS